MTRSDKIKFRLAPVFAVLFAAAIVFALSLIPGPSATLRVPHRKLPTYGFYNMQTLQFTVQNEWDTQLQSAGSRVTVLVTCRHVLADTAVCHGVASNGQAQDVAVQVTQHGNAFKVSQVR